VKTDFIVFSDFLYNLKRIYYIRGILYFKPHTFRYLPHTAYIHLIEADRWQIGIVLACSIIAQVTCK